MVIALIIVTTICTCSILTNIGLSILTYYWVNDWLEEKRQRRLSQENES